MSFPYIKVPRLRRHLVHDPMSGQETLGDWTQADEAEIEDCLFGPATSEDFPDVEIEELTHRAVLYMPLDADVTEFDRVRVDRSLWDVIGRRSNWGDRTGPSGSTVPLRWVRDEGADSEQG